MKEASRPAAVGQARGTARWGVRGPERGREVLVAHPARNTAISGRVKKELALQLVSDANGSHLYEAVSSFGEGACTDGTVVFGAP